MGAPFTTTRGYVRERVLEELYRRPGEFLSTQQLTALIDEADTSADIASICFDLKRTQRLCTGQKVMGANGIPANTWGLSDGERADLERRRPDLAALAAPTVVWAWARLLARLRWASSRRIWRSCTTPRTSERASIKASPTTARLTHFPDNHAFIKCSLWGAAFCLAPGLVNCALKPAAAAVWVGCVSRR